MFDYEQLDTHRVIDKLREDHGYSDEMLESVGHCIGVVDFVPVEELAAAGVPNRIVFAIRRSLS